jgi:putative aldouronate transport system permease protein
MKSYSPGDKMFDAVNAILLIVLSLTCLLPFVNVLAVSLSSSSAANAGEVGLWPVGFNLEAYKFALSRQYFISSIANSGVRLLVGISANMLLTILAAYPLSKNKRVFPGRTIFAWYFTVTMMVSGGLIPMYLVVKATGIGNSIWALVLPYAVPVFNVLVLLNFFRTMPVSIEESAIIDGAGSWRILFHIYVPLALPSLATLVIFQAVFHWNEWLWGLIFMDKINQYPLATYLRNVLQNPQFDSLRLEDIEQSLRITARTARSAQIMIGMLPILMVYPFMQRYFVKGLTLGSVKE